MTRLRGRSMRGERLVAKVPYGQWNTMTLIATLAHDGMRGSTNVDGAVNGDVFQRSSSKYWSPRCRPGNWWLWTNFPATSAPPRGRRLSVGATVLYLPPYSPDFNPIEPAFSKLKRVVRSAGHRTTEALSEPDAEDARPDHRRRRGEFLPP